MGKYVCVCVSRLCYEYIRIVVGRRRRWGWGVGWEVGGGGGDDDDESSVSTHMQSVRQ